MDVWLVISPPPLHDSPISPDPPWTFSNHDWVLVQFPHYACIRKNWITDKNERKVLSSNFFILYNLHYRYIPPCLTCPVFLNFCAFDQLVPSTENYIFSFLSSSNFTYPPTCNSHSTLASYMSTTKIQININELMGVWYLEWEQI